MKKLSDHHPSPSQKFVTQLFNLLDEILFFLDEKALKTKPPYFKMNLLKHNQKIAQTRQSLQDEIKSAKETLQNLFKSYQRGGLQEEIIIDKIKTFQPILLDSLGKRIGVNLNHIPGLTKKLSQIHSIPLENKFAPAPIIQKEEPQLVSVVPNIQSDEPPISLKQIPPHPYASLIARTIDMSQHEKKNDELFSRLPEKIREITQGETPQNREKLAEFIVKYNQQDLLGLIIILLTQPDAKDLSQIIETEVPAGFWESILAGEHKEMGYPTAEYQISSTKTPGYIPFGLPGYLGPKKKQCLTLLPHRISDYKNQPKGLLNRNPREIVFGTFCYFQAKNYLLAIEGLTNVNQLFESDSFSINNEELLLKIARELNIIARNEYHDKLQLKQCSLRSFYHDFYLRQIDPIKIMWSQESISYMLNELQQVIQTTLTVFTKHLHAYLKLGHFWGDYQCAQMLYELLQKRQTELPPDKLITSSVAQIVLIGNPTKDKHWLTGHLLYIRMLKDLIEILVRQDQKNHALIYECCLNAIKNIFVASHIQNYCNSITHNAYLGSEELLSQFQPQKNWQSLYHFFNEQAQKINPITITRSISRQLEIAEKFSISLGYK